jgi:hypothetical protein
MILDAELKAHNLVEWSDTMLTRASIVDFAIEMIVRLLLCHPSPIPCRGGPSPSKSRLSKWLDGHR